MGSSSSRKKSQPQKQCLTFPFSNAIVTSVIARALSSVGERFVHTEEATGSSPVAPIPSLPIVLLDSPLFAHYTTYKDPYRHVCIWHAISYIVCLKSNTGPTKRGAY